MSNHDYVYKIANIIVKLKLNNSYTKKGLEMNINQNTNYQKYKGNLINNLLNLKIVTVLIISAIFGLSIGKAEAATPCATTNNTGIVNAAVNVVAPSSPVNIDSTNYNDYRVWLYVRADAAGSVSVDVDGDVCETINVPSGAYKWVSGSKDRNLAGGNRNLRVIGNTSGVYLKRAMIINSNCIPVNETGDCPTEIINPVSNVAPKFDTFTVNPTAGTALTNIKLSATVSDPDNDGINQVEFFRNGVSLGSDNIAPFEVNVNGLAAGTYNFTAKVTDNDQVSKLTTTSTTIPVVINAPAPTNSAPVVSQLYSSSTSLTDPATFSLTANASDPDNNLQKVVFTQIINNSNTTICTISSSTSHICNVSNLAAGTYTFNAQAYDTAGLTSPIKSISVTVAPKPVLPPVSTCAGTNVALNKPATSSSTDGFLLPSRAFDGSVAKGATAKDDSRWSSAHGMDQQYLMVDIGSPHDIKCLSINWETAAATNYNIEVSDTANGTFKKIAEVTNGVPGIKIIDNVSNASGRFVKLNGVTRSTIYGFSVWEFGVFGTPKVSTDPNVDSTAPTGPTTITGASISYNGWVGGCSPSTGCKITLSWPNATDTGGSGFSHYDVYNGSQKINTSPVTTNQWIHTGVTGGGTYSYKVFSFDKAGNRSTGSATLNKTISCSPFLWTAICSLK